MKRIIFGLCLTVLLAACNNNNDKTSSDGAPAAATLYYNGDIITMEGDSAQYAEALVVENGRIAFAGSLAEAEKMAPGAAKTDLAGKTLLPGFLDGHGHAFNAGVQAVSANLLPAPDGTANDIATVIRLLKEWRLKNESAVKQYGWIIGFGYDDAQLKEKEHPTADDLDKVSDSLPIVIIHQSAHLASLNHKALEIAKYTSATPNPTGGVIRRKAGTKEPNGVVEEMAFYNMLFPVLGSLTKETNKIIALAGVDAYTRFGYTTLQEGRATKAACDTWFELAKENKLTVDIACYPDIQAEMPYMKANGVQKDYNNHVRIAGVKLSLDGSPQGRTAWLSKPYKVPPAGLPKTYNGYPAIPNQKEVQAFVDSAFANNWQIMAHCNGDAAIDLYNSVVRNAANQYGNNNRRTIAIHAQTARFDQLDTMKALEIIPSFFGMHTYYWGDWHRDVTLGKERAYRISPAQTALKKGMIFTEHHDAPVALPSSIMVLYSTVNRISRSGDVIGPDERISAYDALRSLTSWAAFQYFEDDKKGTLTKGKLADLVILDKNPLKVAPQAIKEIQVLTTIKEGKVVYQKQ
jgi:predicted amidohydrolase YtcJ